MWFDAEERVYQRGHQAELLLLSTGLFVGHKDELVFRLGPSCFGAANVGSSILFLPGTRRNTIVKPAQRTWKDFLEFPGKTGHPKRGYETVEFALLGDGRSKEEKL